MQGYWHQSCLICCAGSCQLWWVNLRVRCVEPKQMKSNSDARFISHIVQFSVRSTVLEKLLVPHWLKKFPTFGGTQESLSCLWFVLSGAELFHSTHSHPISVRSILILPSHPHFGLPRSLCLSCCPVITVHSFYFAYQALFDSLPDCYLVRSSLIEAFNYVIFSILMLFPCF